MAFVQRMWPSIRILSLKLTSADKEQTLEYIVYLQRDTEAGQGGSHLGVGCSRSKCGQRRG